MNQKNVSIKANAGQQKNKSFEPVFKPSSNGQLGYVSAGTCEKMCEQMCEQTCEK